MPVDLGPADLEDGELSRGRRGRSRPRSRPAGRPVRGLRTLVHAPGMPAQDGWLEGEAIRCACHGSLFALADGTPLEGPATRRIRVYPAVATVAGRLEVDDPYPARVTLRLDVSARAGARARAAEIVAEAWRSFDHARAERAADRRPAAPRCSRRRCPRRRRPRWRCSRMPAARWTSRSPRSAPSLLRLRRLVRARDRRARRPARVVLRRQPRGLGGRGLGDRGSGDPLGGGVRRLPGRRGGVHERRHGLQHDRARGSPGARDPGLASSGPRRLARRRSTARSEAHYSIERAAELLGIGSANVRSLPIDGDRRLAPEAVAGAIRADRAAGSRPGRGRRDGGHDADRGGRPDRRDSPTSAPTPASGSTSTAPTASPPPPTPSAGHLFAGLDRADSVTLDAHKWLYLPEGLRGAPRPAPRRPRRGVRPRGGVHPARAHGPHGRHHARVLPPVPGA